MDIISECVKSLEQSEKLRLLKGLAKDRGVQRRLDENYLSRFLIGRNFDIDPALKALCNYESFVSRRTEVWFNLDKNKLNKILSSQVIDVLDGEGSKEQKVVWLRPCYWDPQAFTADEILQVSGLLCELVYSKTTHIKFLDVIIDLDNFQLKHLYALSPKFAKRMMFFMAECLPMQILNVYVIRQPKLFYLLYALFKPFVSERMKKMIIMCGENYSSLSENIGREVLPEELSGQSKQVFATRWLENLQKRNILQDLKLSGYKFYLE